MLFSTATVENLEERSFHEDSGSGRDSSDAGARMRRASGVIREYKKEKGFRSSVDNRFLLIEGCLHGAVLPLR